jgi:hypothetical protein
MGGHTFHVALIAIKVLKLNVSNDFIELITLPRRPILGAENHPDRRPDHDHGDHHHPHQHRDAARPPGPQAPQRGGRGRLSRATRGRDQGRLLGSLLAHQDRSADSTTGCRQRPAGRSAADLRQAHEHSPADSIQIGPEEWAHVYVHFDGYPAHMLPALARWKPTHILAAIDIRQVTPEALDCFSPPRDPRILPNPTREFAHLYIWISCQWVHVVPQADADRIRAGSTIIKQRYCYDLPTLSTPSERW